MAASRGLLSVEFEVFGKVQGVFFRKHTQKTALSLGLTGWVKNTHRGTVQGEMQGAVENVNQMKQWLKTIGSPKSKIRKAEFKNERTLDRLTSEGFIIKK